jgi:hypothetical protein
LHRDLFRTLRQIAYTATAAIVTVGLLATGMVALSSEKSSTFSASTSGAIYDVFTASKPTKQELSVGAFNKYGNIKDSTFAYPFLQDALLVEPYKSTTFRVANGNEGCSYKWKIVGEFYWSYGVACLSMSDAEETGKTYSEGLSASSQIEVPLLTDATARYTLSVDEVDCSDSSEEARHLSKDIYVKYVRRELGALDGEDRDAFLDAFSTLWTVGTVEGQAKYGDKYKSLYYFAQIHQDAGANDICDEFHGNKGFVNNHVMLGAYLEQSLQLVNPSVALHYMEYSKYFTNSSFEVHLSSQLDGGSWTPLFTDMWFGTSDPDTGKIISKSNILCSLFVGFKYSARYRWTVEGDGSA